MIRWYCEDNRSREVPVPLFIVFLPFFGLRAPGILALAGFSLDLFFFLAPAGWSANLATFGILGKGRYAWYHLSR